jgi:hypothetical protein
VLFARVAAPAPSRVVDVPLPGRIAAATLGDGTPVWVGAVADGAVTVLEARSPAPWFRLPELVGWCPASGSFVAYASAAEWDPDGTWLFGPAPRDLATFPVRATAAGGRQVRVGFPLVPDGRSAPRARATVDRCALDGDPVGDPASYHVAADAPVTPLADAGRDPVVLAGALVLRAGHDAQFCERLVVPGEPRCPPHAPLVPEAADLDTGSVLRHGRILATVDGPALRGVTLLPGGSTARLGEGERREVDVR